MKKKIILFAIVSLITTGSIFAKKFIYTIKCDGKEYKGYMSAKDRDEAIRAAADMAAELC